MFKKMNLKLFPKMFLMTFITILSTILLFSFIFRLIYVSYINNYTQQQFYSNVTEFEREINKLDLYNALYDGYITRYTAENNLSTIILNENNVVIYPSMQNISGMISSPAMISENSMKFADSVQVQMKNTLDLQSTFEIEYNGLIYTFIVQSSNFIDNKEFSAIFFSTLPYMMFLGLIVSALISYIFAKATSKKINHLNDVMTSMETLTYTPLEEKISGDEISDLENHIDQLYKRMIDEMDKIKKFEKDREVFMKGSIHELKTPLMVMSLHLNELLEHSLDDFTQTKVLELYQKTNHMNKLVSEVLKASKLETIIRDEVIQPKDLIKDIVDLYSYMLDDKNITLTLDISDENILMNADDFNRVISNLLSNAIKYSDDYDVITLDFDLKTLVIKNHFHLEWNSDIDIFSPFVHSNENKDSHGLGLYVVSMILNKYDYEYTYDITDNQFTFTINFNKEH